MATKVAQFRMISTAENGVLWKKRTFYHSVCSVGSKHCRQPAWLVYFASFHFWLFLWINASQAIAKFIHLPKNMTQPSCHRRPNLLSESTKALKWLKMTLALSSDLCVGCRIHGNMTSGSLYLRNGRCWPRISHNSGFEVCLRGFVTHFA